MHFQFPLATAVAAAWVMNAQLRKDLPSTGGTASSGRHINLAPAGGADVNHSSAQADEDGTSFSQSPPPLRHFLRPFCSQQTSSEGKRIVYNLRFPLFGRSCPPSFLGFC